MTVAVHEGGCVEVLAELASESVQCCITSPPYWGLRDYGVAGQLGLERTPDEYVAKMVEVFAAVRRVLRDDGTLWLNLGDSYSARAGQRKTTDVAGIKQQSNVASVNAPSRCVEELGPKQLVGIPWRVAFALQADGWYLRSDLIWSKPNGMPESVTDRPTKSHEYLFLLSKCERYYYDANAIKEPAGGWNGSEFHDGKNAIVHPDVGRNRGRPNGAATFEKFGHNTSCGTSADGSRNRRSVWTVATTPYSGAHFATFPPKLIEPCILAGTSRQACEQCGAAWQRVTEVTGVVRVREGSDTSGGSALDAAKGRHGANSIFATGEKPVRETTGFAPSCDCDNNPGSARGVVLDPFGGAGTTGLVADRLGRNAVLIELNPEYAKMARERIRGDSPLFADVDGAA